MKLTQPLIYFTNTFNLEWYTARHKTNANYGYLVFD